MDQVLDDAIAIAQLLESAGFAPGPRLFAACTRLAAMGAVSTGAPLETLLQEAKDAYRWAAARHYEAMRNSK